LSSVDLISRLNYAVGVQYFLFLYTPNYANFCCYIHAGLYTPCSIIEHKAYTYALLWCGLIVIENEGSQLNRLPEGSVEWGGGVFEGSVWRKFRNATILNGVETEWINQLTATVTALIERKLTI
jgi:hypothetical protein